MRLIRWSRWAKWFALAALLVVVAAVWIILPPALTTTETAILGLWSSAPQPDGLSTTILLRSDRTGTVRWVDPGGGDGRTPHECRWWIEEDTLFVDTSRLPGFFEFGGRGKNIATAWALVIQADTLLYNPNAAAPVSLRRVGQH